MTALVVLGKMALVIVGALALYFAAVSFEISGERVGHMTRCRGIARARLCGLLFAVVGAALLFVAGSL